MAGSGWGEKVTSQLGHVVYCPPYTLILGNSCVVELSIALSENPASVSTAAGLKTGNSITHVFQGMFPVVSPL